jgi:hypothetical protein
VAHLSTLQTFSHQNATLHSNYVTTRGQDDGRSVKCAQVCHTTPGYSALNTAVLSTLETRNSGTKNVYKTKSARCQNLHLTLWGPCVGERPIHLSAKWRS